MKVGMVEQVQWLILLPSLKLTEKAPANWWLEDDPFLLGKPIFRGELLVLGSVAMFFL